MGGRSTVAVAVNIGLTLLNLQVGKRIQEEMFKGSRAGYEKKIVATLSQQLSWSHFVDLITQISQKEERHPVLRRFISAAKTAF